MIVELMIPGKPVPKGRPRVGKSGHVYTPTRTRNAEELVAWYARSRHVSFGRIPVIVHADFYGAHASADTDNLLKLVLDGLQAGGAFVNDRQVIGVHAHRHPCGKGEERTVIRIEQAEETAA